jgi:DNA repair protein RecO (recombination protein O)
MDEPAQGIVLRYHPFSETSLIVRWLTPNQGRIDTIARGARRPKSPFRGKLDLFYLAEFSFARSRHSELHSLREIRLQNTFAPLRADLSRLRLASYASALISQTVEPGPPLPEIFDLFHGLLLHLALHPPTPLHPLAFELKLLHALGQEPGPAELRLSPVVRQIATACQNLQWHQLTPQPPPHIKELNEALRGFLEFNLGRLPAQRDSVFLASLPG